MHYFMYKIYVRNRLREAASSTCRGPTPVLRYRTPFEYANDKYTPCGEIKIFGRSDIFLYSANKYLTNTIYAEPESA